MLHIKLKEGQQVWFCSDFHINHRNLVRGTSSWTEGYRDFDTLQQMEDTIVSNFNSVVKPDDIVFNLGDVIFGDKTYLPSFLAKLNCKNIYLLRGNHDDYLDKYPEFKKLFLGVYDYLEVAFNFSDVKRNIHRPKKQFIVMCHYPLKTWRDASKKSLMLFGHEHGNMTENINSYTLDVGVDTSWYNHKKYYPYSLDEIENIMYNQKKDWLKVGHHTGV